MNNMADQKPPLDVNALNNVTSCSESGQKWLKSMCEIHYFFPLYLILVEITSISCYVQIFY